MDRLFKRLFRLRKLRREATIKKRRNNNLIANSNCIGTTARLFSQQPRAVAWNVKTTKKPVGKRT